MWKTLLFDFDGTIAETGEGVKKSFQYALEQMGRPVPTFEELDACIGPPLQDSFRDFFGMNEEETEEAVRLYRQRYTKTGIYEVGLYSGLTEALTELKRRGFTLAVASCKPEVMVKKILSYFGIESFFATAVGSNLDGTRSTKKAVIDEALRRLNLSADRSQVVYIGDRKYDIIGARQCGLASIGVTYGYGSFEELKDVRPTFMAATPAMIVDLVGEENARSGYGRAQAASPNGSYTYGQGAPAYAAGTRQAPPQWATGAAAPVPARKESIPLKIWRIIYPIALYFVVINVVTVAISLIYGIVMALSGYYGDFTEALFDHAMTLQGFAELIVIPVLWMFMKKDKGLRAVRGKESAYLDGARLTLPLIIVTAVLAIAAGTAAGFLVDLTGIPDIDQSFQEFNDMAYLDPLPLQILSIGILGPIAEELVFRALIFRRIRDYLNPKIAIVLSAVMFGAFHMNWTQALFATALGILFACLYEKYGRLWVPIIGHMANNIYATLANNLASETSFLNSGAFYIICLVLTVLLIVMVFVLKKPPVGEKTPEISRKRLF